MAITCGGPTINLKRDIVENGETYDFYQAVKMLNRLAAAQPGKTATNLRIQPELNLDYPDADIAEISHDDEQGFQITTTFFGLYGVSSPLPGFYTEELLDDEWDELHNRKDLFDVIHHQVYPLLYQAWLKYKFAHNTVESDKRKYWEIIFDLAGLGDSYRQDRSRYAGLARFAGLLGQRNKSLLGLKTLLREQLGDIAVDIQPCVLRKVGIARHQRCLLGKQNSRLGEDACIGKEVDDRNGKFRVEIGPLNASEFARFTTRTQLLSDIRDLIRLYLVQPLAFTLSLLLEPLAATPVSLGSAQSSVLGRNCWLIDKPNAAVESIELQQSQGDCGAR